MRKFSERDFQRMVIDFAKLCGWLVFHDYDSTRSEPGFPDLFMVRGERVVQIELKSEAGRVRKEQKTWLWTLRHSVVETYLLRPTDWDDFKRILGPRETDAFQRDAGQPIPDDWDPRLQQRRRVA